MLKEIAKMYQFESISLSEFHEDSKTNISSVWLNLNNKKIEINLSIDTKKMSSLIVLKSNHFTEEERLVITKFICDIEHFILFRYRIEDNMVVGPTIKDVEVYKSLLNLKFDIALENQLKRLFLNLQKSKYELIDEENFPHSTSDEYMDKYHLRAYLWGKESEDLLLTLQKMKLISFFKNKLGEFEYNLLFEKNKRDKISCYRILSNTFKEMGYDARYGFVHSEVYQERFI